MQYVNINFPFVSVVVPTMNRKKYLEACLISLSNLDYPKSMLEIIVVDGGSSDGTESMLLSNFKGVKIVTEKRAGISLARNTGGEAAHGEIIAFTDDDCIADTGWVRNLVTAFAEDSAAAAGGPNILLHPDLFQEKFLNSPTLGVFSLGDKKISVDFLITANFAIRRKVFQNIKFDVMFGRRNTAIYKWEEDVEFCQRLISAGYELTYIPTAIVYHNINPIRAGLKYIILKEFSGGLSHYMIERKSKSKITIGIISLRGFVRNILLFFRTRSIASFCWILKCYAMILASIFLP